MRIQFIMVVTNRRIVILKVFREIARSAESPPPLPPPPPLLKKTEKETNKTTLTGGKHCSRTSFMGSWQPSAKLPKHEQPALRQLACPVPKHCIAAEYAGSHTYFIGRLVPSLSMHACAIWHGDAPSSSSSSSSPALPVVPKRKGFKRDGRHEDQLPRRNMKKHAKRVDMKADVHEGLEN